MHATHILYQAAQPPKGEVSHTGTCRICGEQAQGVPFAAWVRDTFTNHDQLRPGDIICHICQFAFVQDSSLLQERTGKDKPQRMQNYSHIVLRGEWYPLHKGQKGELLALLRQEPELVAIAVSGQKHVIFRTRPGWWQVEEQAVLPNLQALDACLTLIDKLYGIFNKTEIETGNYSPGRMMQYAQAHGLADFLSTDTALKPWRGTAYFELALYLAQKEQTDGAVQPIPGDVPSGTDAANPTVARSERRVQTEIRTQHLGAVRGQHSSGSVHQPPEQVLQLDLFSTGDNTDS